mmetsp:Transcript_33908/g.86130  ORF Transcript_33908/g.86130 Transcript_33908/m.86130 type:complete len:226 (-) Transcript_33908:196-873(-)
MELGVVGARHVQRRRVVGRAVLSRDDAHAVERAARRGLEHLQWPAVEGELLHPAAAAQRRPELRDVQVAVGDSDAARPVELAWLGAPAPEGAHKLPLQIEDLYALAVAVDDEDLVLGGCESTRAEELPLGTALAPKGAQPLERLSFEADHAVVERIRDEQDTTRKRGPRGKAQLSLAASILACRGDRGPIQLELLHAMAPVSHIDGMPIARQAARAQELPRSVTA